jgi:hypothetical protein
VYCSADPDVVLSPIPELKGSFHVTGELAIVHPITMAAAITNLKRLKALLFFQIYASSVNKIL